MKKEIIARTELVLSVIIFGTIGIIRRYIALPSGFVAMARGLLGAAFLLGLMVFMKKKPDIKAIKSKLPLLCLSGAFIGLNWMLLFESFNMTTVAAASVCYYTAPVFVIIASPFVLKEKMTVKKIVCGITALAGVVFVSGIFDSGFSGLYKFKGVILALLAAVLYASVILINKKLYGLSAFDRTAVQLFVAGAVMIPYTFLAEKVNASMFDTRSILFLIILSVVHTSLSYAAYFASFEKMSATAVSVISYGDPVVSVILSVFILKETGNVLFTVIGTLLVIGSAVIIELPTEKK